MKSILEGRDALRREVEKIAEVAGYLWQNGWAERNGGNITVNITKFIDDEVRAMPAISEVKQIGTTLPTARAMRLSPTIWYSLRASCPPISPFTTI